MQREIFSLIDILAEYHSLTIDDYRYLIANRNVEVAKYIKHKARDITNKIYGKKIFVRGLIEITNYCKNNCLYCGIRCGNSACERYRLTLDQILQCCEDGYNLGLRTFVLQGGEDPYFTDDLLCELIHKIKSKYRDCAVTLSLGEKPKESYKKLCEAGADRYLLRHETANEEHYGKLHPKNMSFANRMQALCDLKDLGYQTGCGFMVNSPYQTESNLAEDLKFIEFFQPDMCGIGPFIPHQYTPFREFSAGSVDLTCYLLSIVRLICPQVLLPATTALGTLDAVGRERAIRSGANVLMPNLSPMNVRAKYTLYDNKLCTGDESAQEIKLLKEKIALLGYEVVIDRGDVKNIYAYA